jgi:hypothetical protein
MTAVVKKCVSDDWCLVSTVPLFRLFQDCSSACCLSHELCPRPGAILPGCAFLKRTPRYCVGPKPPTGPQLTMGHS